MSAAGRRLSQVMAFGGARPSIPVPGRSPGLAWRWRQMSAMRDLGGGANAGLGEES